MLPAVRNIVLGGASNTPTWSWDFRAGIPSGSTFTRASSGWYFDASRTLVSASSNVPRFAYDPATGEPWGYLAEMQSTNSIRNNTMQGAAAGTPGTNPTNWGFSSSVNGITRTIVGTGTEDGIPYIDYQYTGTPSASLSLTLAFEAFTGIAAASGQTWTGSIYVRLMAGSFANLSSGGISHFLTERDSGGTSLVSTSQIITPTNAALKTQRFSLTRTLNNASTAFVSQTGALVYTSGNPIDITLRFGLPQVEQGVGMTSPILTSGAAVTRSQDILTLPLTSLPGWNASKGGVLVAAYRLHTVVPLSRYAIYVSENANNRVFVRADNASGIANTIMTSGGVTQFNINGAATSLFTRVKLAVGWSTGRGQLSQDGAAPIIASGTYSLPIGMLNMDIGRATSSSLNGTLESIAYYAGERTDSFVQAVSR